jgi:hypothetical protein
MKPPTSRRSRGTEDECGDARLTLAEAMKIADEAACGQLSGYFDDETGEDTIDDSDPTRDHHAIFVVRTVRQNYGAAASRADNLRSLASAFRALGGQFKPIGDAFDEARACDEGQPI